MLNIHHAQIRIGSYASTNGFMLTKVVVCFLEQQQQLCTTKLLYMFKCFGKLNLQQYTKKFG